MSLLRRIIRKTFKVHYRLSYSQEGEDLLLARHFKDRIHLPGFYVDVGAHHPQKLSNTYYFYKKGWRGLNIDAQPGSMERFNSIRPADINIEAAIGNDPTPCTFYMFEDPALNTFDTSLADERAKTYDSRGQAELTPKKLSEVFDESLPPNTTIDFMNVDVEGRDLDVLESNNWDTYRPGIIIAESLHSHIDEIKDDPVYRFLTDKGYRFLAKTIHSLFFVSQDS